MRRSAAALALAAGLAGCGGGSSGAPAGPCSPPGAGVDPDRPAQRLSELCLVEAAGGGTVAPRPGVVPYDLNTPLFSDYALKTRTVWLPPGTRAAYDAEAPLDLPVGAIVTKTFALPPDLRTPTAALRLLETRLLVRTAQGWRGYPYLWNAAQTDATFQPGGAVLQLPLVTPSGAAVTASYLVPSVTQCARCHADTPDGALHLLGPTARNLNRTLGYPSGPENQLAHWSAAGILVGAPAPADAPRLPVWNDPGTGSVAARARAWLEVNCAFCHSPGGLARTTGLYLGTGVTDPYQLGVCKPPVAAGPGSGGLAYDVVPGDPDASILVYRVAATDPVAVMPQLGRSVVSDEGLALVRQWIAELPSQPCP
ncbi:conserved hypothetical protein [Anaeromyxobacter dehalogenans 2CP-1]|uniref:Cytochrome c domain-containing protein n=1 Tax=Anaeromyxobacter dehalogenans (strain ATCC BAA-258 / DSM 21875 / 2CP-1) TaxID=455488 RepID=B8JE74_ANAD2|nr:SO2930 family diheme c-type cytochrome [Anaeromyxobacter dehalogenans]ACL66139.1 conserved hypothetical protein [Anaeromyxobacter dehalogenans 2CP-1]